MIKHGNPPYLECSSKGDKRFSAFYARIQKYNNESIEQIYQKSKLFKGTNGEYTLDWRKAKGKRAINQNECRKLYKKLWKQYINENPHLENILIKATGLSDIFGQKGHCCQATELWKIRKRLIKERRNDKI